MELEPSPMPAVQQDEDFVRKLTKVIAIHAKARIEILLQTTDGKRCLVLPPVKKINKTTVEQHCDFLCALIDINDDDRMQSVVLVQQALKELEKHHGSVHESDFPLSRATNAEEQELVAG